MVGLKTTLCSQFGGGMCRKMAVQREAHNNKSDNCHFDYSTVTDLARLRGLSTSVPRAQAAW